MLLFYRFVGITQEASHARDFCFFLPWFCTLFPRNLLKEKKSYVMIFLVHFHLIFAENKNSFSRMVSSSRQDTLSIRKGRLKLNN